MIRFNIKAGEGSLTTVPLGRVPGGYRLQVNYSAAVRFAGARDQEVFDGSILTGSDWVLLRDDGVAVFDAHITFKARLPGSTPEKPKFHVFDADVSGQVRLKKNGWLSPINSLRDLLVLRDDLTVVLPIQFESSLPAPDGSSDQILTAAENAPFFADLTEHQYLARGTFHLNGGSMGAADLEIASADTTLQRERDSGRLDAKQEIDRLKAQLRSSRGDEPPASNDTGAGVSGVVGSPDRTGTHGP